MLAADAKTPVRLVSSALARLAIELVSTYAQLISCKVLARDVSIRTNGVAVQAPEV